jgi:K+/H+ antiporter YhaU regulatory subunit KhtT
MIEFDISKNTSILPEGSEKFLPKKEDIEYFFENYFKKDVDSYLIYKKNSFKTPNREVLFEFLNKFESFIKSENNEDNNQNVHLIFENISNCFKILENNKMLPEEKKMMSFFISFVISKFLA